MTALTWDDVGSKSYQTGVNKGVLYYEGGDGVAWNGLTSIEEADNTIVEPVYFDGFKFNDIVTVGDFSAILRAFTYPDEFLPHQGVLEDQTGFYVTGQSPPRFGLSYQTLIRNDLDEASGYKIHLLYNLTAVPSNRTYETLSLDINPVEFEWTLTSVPEEIANFKATAHIILDSTKVDPFLLRDVEDILYGGDEHLPHLPSLQTLATFVRHWNRFIIIDNGDGTWTADDKVGNIISFLDADTFQIVSDQAVFLDADSYTLTSSDKNEDDIWLP